MVSKDARWWDAAGAEVWPGWYDDDAPSYGPRITLRRDQTGHHPAPEHEVWKVDGSTLLLTNCECGWRDFSHNYPDHLADVAPLVEVFT